MEAEVMRLLGIKPVAVGLLSVSAVGMTAVGSVLQHSGPKSPVVITKVVPTVIRIPGHKTIIIQQTVVPRPGSTRTVPGPRSTVRVPGGSVTVTPRPRPGPTVTITPTPGPSPTHSCIHPPGQK